jgi:hypothetical protein
VARLIFFHLIRYTQHINPRQLKHAADDTKKKTPFYFWLLLEEEKVYLKLLKQTSDHMQPKEMSIPGQLKFFCKLHRDTRDEAMKKLVLDPT